MEYRDKYMLLTKQYTDDVDSLHSALKDLYASISGQEKSCGHTFTCTCPSDKARELINLFNNDEPKD